jgi:hypothetical protein
LKAKTFAAAIQPECGGRSKLFSNRFKVAAQATPSCSLPDLRISGKIMTAALAALNFDLQTRAAQRTNFLLGAPVDAATNHC